MLCLWTWGGEWTAGWARCVPHPKIGKSRLMLQHINSRDMNVLSSIWKQSPLQCISGYDICGRKGNAKEEDAMTSGSKA